MVIMPSTVSTSISVPSAASTIPICSWLRIKSPSRVNFLCALTRILMYKSPRSPSAIASPRSRKRIVEPSSIPAGILTVIFCSRRCTPEPWQTVHSFSGILPRPLQVSQTTACWIGPNIVFIVRTRWPAPWQSGQVFISKPGSTVVPWQCSHSSLIINAISTSLPNTASSKVKVTRVSTSRPRGRLLRRDCPDGPPKN